uniref:Uncharacterized protein n=1 Tax=Anopheles albimanus TaxID=7167 RepID=A0A182FYF7_ANOAL
AFQEDGRGTWYTVRSIAGDLCFVAVIRTTALGAVRCLAPSDTKRKDQHESNGLTAALPQCL